MRTLLTVLLAAGVVSAGDRPGPTVPAPIPPPPTIEVAVPPIPSKHFDVADLVGVEGFFPTSDELASVIHAATDPRIGRLGLEFDPQGRTLIANGDPDALERVKILLDSFRKVRERRNTQITVECLLLATSKNTGESLMLPKDDERPVLLTEKEAALTKMLIRAFKAEGHIDVFHRPTLTLLHGQEGIVRVGQEKDKPDAGLSLKMTATMQDSGRVVIRGNGSYGDGTGDKVTMTHEGKFATEISSGGTAVARIPTLAGGTEMYLMLKVASVGPAKKVEAAKAKAKAEVLPRIELPTPVTLTPTLGAAWEVIGERTFTCQIPLVPPITKPGEELRFVGENGMVFIPAAELGKPTTPFGFLTRNPYFGTLWTDKPKPAQKSYWGFGGCSDPCFEY